MVRLVCLFLVTLGLHASSSLAVNVGTANELYQAIVNGEPHIIITDHLTFSGFFFTASSLDSAVETPVPVDDQLPLQLLGTKTIRVR
jgi:hypothetical protein